MRKPVMLHALFAVVPFSNPAHDRPMTVLG